MSEANNHQEIESPEIEDETILEWTSHPARKRPLITILLVIFLTALVLIVYSLTESYLFTAIGAVVLWGSLTQYFMSTRFILSEQGVKVRYVINKIEKPWSQFRTYYRDKNGVLLSPFVRPSRMENFRGLYVRFDNNQDEVMNVVSERIKMIKDED